MAVQKITYINKTALQNDEDLPDTAKVKDVDMNQIKDIVNNNADILENKVDKITGKSLSTNDFTAIYKTKLDGIATGANNYSLPTASASILGGVKVGTGLNITGGVLSSTGGTTIVDNLTSTSNTSALSANQGKILNDKVEKIKNRIKIFSGTVASGSTITITDTWANLGKFKNLLIELYVTSVNSRGFIVIPYELLSTGDDLFSGKRNANIYSGVYIYDGFKAIHNIPNADITANTIKFDSYTGNIVKMYVEY